jgi:hypothetical protein
LLSGLTIKDGNGQCDDPHSGCDGGGVLNEGQLTILDCCITNSRVVGIAIAAGGGISSTGSLTMSNVAVVNNSAYTTGGIKSIGNLNMTNCSIVGNGSHQGVGGIYCIGTNNIVKCQINHNGSDAGGLWVAGVTVITDTSISGNMAEPPWGIAGGIFSTGVVSLVNCTLSGNIFWDTYQAPGQASAIVNIGTLSAVNCTIISNQMWGWSSNTAGVYNSGAFLARNTIIANSLTGRQTPFTNLGPDFAGALASQGFNLIRDPTYAVISGDPTGNIYGLDPLLGPLGDNGGGTWTHALLPGSPAIDAGTIFGAPLTDQRGVPRPQGQRVDIGAYEVPCPQCGPLMITQLQRVAEGCTVLTASGIPGDICQVLGSADSLTWQPLGTGTNVAGTVLFTDGTCSGVNNRFYRLQKTGPPAF